MKGTSKIGGNESGNSKEADEEDIQAKADT